MRIRFRIYGIQLIIDTHKTKLHYSIREISDICGAIIPLIYRIFSNLIRTSFCRFLKRKKTLVPGSNPLLSFNRPLPTRQTNWIILDVTNALTVIRLIHIYIYIIYKVVQIWPGLVPLVYTQISPGHIWTTFYIIYIINNK